MSLETTKKVSVIIPTYKRPGKLGRAIESVLSQTYSNVEIIVVDDNSDGDEYRRQTEEFMQPYIDLNKVTYLKHRLNKNGSAARNTGLTNCSGEFVCFLDDDDFFFPTKIERQVSMLSAASNSVGAVCCNHISKYKNYTYNKNLLKVCEGGNYLSSLLSGENVLAAGSTLMVRRSVFKEIGYFDESYVRHQDYEFLARFFRQYKMLIQDEYLVAICVEGFRNYPNAEQFHQIKSKFLMDFENDIKKLSNNEIKKIMLKQWSEVVTYYLNDGAFRKANQIYNTKILEHDNSLSILYWLKALYLISERKVPFLQPLKYKFCSLRYAKGDILKRY